MLKEAEDFSFTSVIVVGDGNGHVGIGLGKANEVSSAIAKGSDDARKNLVYVPLEKAHCLMKLSENTEQEKFY